MHTSRKRHKFSGTSGAHPLTTSTLHQITPPNLETSCGVSVKDTGDTVDDYGKEEDLENEEKDACNSVATADKAEAGDVLSGLVSVEAANVGGTDKEETHQIVQEESDAREYLSDKEKGTSEDEKDTTEGDQESPSLLLNHPRLGYTHLPQLPENFRCITCKYTRNRSSTPWSSSVPHYLLRRHSFLPSSLTSLPDHPFPGEKPCAVDSGERTSLGQRKSSQGFAEESDGGGLAAVSGRPQAKTPVWPNSSCSGLIPKIAENVRGRLVTFHGLGDVQNPLTEGKVEGDCKLPRLHAVCGEDGETGSRDTESTTTSLRHEAQLQKLRAAEGRAAMSASGTNDELLQDIPMLSSLLTPSGSRVPHRLGLRYKTDAHKR